MGGGRPWQVPSERVPAGDALADWSQGLPPACLNACRVPPPLPQVPRGGRGRAQYFLEHSRSFSSLHRSEAGNLTLKEKPLVQGH